MIENKILATVEDRAITQQDVDRLLQSLGQQRGAQFNNAEGKKRLLEELINQEMFYLDAVEKGLNENDDFKSEVEKMKAELLKQYAVSKSVEGVAVEEEETFEYYKQHRNEFKTPEMVRAKHILVDDVQLANQIYADLKKGLFFEEAAKKYSKCPSTENGGDLDFFARGQMVQEFEDVAFSMEINDISQPVQTQFGYHIIKLTDKKKPGTSDFNDVKDQIKVELKGMKQSQKYAEETNKLKGKYAVKVNV